MMLAGMLMLCTLVAACENRYHELDLTMYQYRDTKNLVRFVWDASRMLRRDGDAAIDYFKRNRAVFATPDYYLYYLR